MSKDRENPSRNFPGQNPNRQPGKDPSDQENRNKPGQKNDFDRNSKKDKYSDK